TPPGAAAAPVVDRLVRRFGAARAGRRRGLVQSTGELAVLVGGIGVDGLFLEIDQRVEVGQVLLLFGRRRAGHVAPVRGGLDVDAGLVPGVVFVVASHSDSDLLVFELVLGRRHAGGRARGVLAAPAAELVVGVVVIGLCLPLLEARFL